MTKLRSMLAGSFMSGWAVWIIVALIVVLATILSTSFLTTANLLNYLGQTPALILVTAGMFIAIIAGQIDLSVAALVKLTAVLVSGIADGDPTKFTFAVILVYAIGLAVGLFNAFLVVKLKIPSFVATLGTFSILEGLVLAYTVKGVGSVPTPVVNFFYEGIGPIPYPFMIVITLIAFLSYWLNHSRTGLRLYAVGGNAEFARRSGVSPGRVITIALVLTSLFAVTAGIAQVSRAGVGAPTTGAGLELMAITAVVLGGASLLGGRGKIFGALGGAILITLIDNALNMVGVSQYTQGLFRGSVIVLAIAVFVTKKGRFG